MKLSASILPALLVTVIGCGASTDESDHSVESPQNPSNPPDNPASHAWRTLITADWTLPAGTEGYWCARQTVKEDLFVAGFEAMAPLGTHHSLLTIGYPTAPDGVSQCRFDTLFPDSAFGSGVGTKPLEFPDGVATMIPKGMQLLLNLHLFNAGGSELSGTSGTRIRTIPKSEVIELAEHFAAGTDQLQIPPRETTIHTGFCTMRGDVTLLAVAPHMHMLGRHEKVVAETAAGEITLLDTPYEFGEQTYSLFEPLKLLRGDRVRVECTHENTTEKLVMNGDSSLAEMCVAAMYRYPAGTSVSFNCMND